MGPERRCGRQRHADAESDADAVNGRSHDDYYCYARVEIGKVEDRIAVIARGVHGYAVGRAACASPVPFRTSAYHTILRTPLPICESAGRLFCNT